MKVLQSVLIFVVATLILISCSPGMRYSSSEDFVTDSGVIVRVQALADADSGVLKVEVYIENGSAEGVLIMPGSSQLRSPEGFKVPPRKAKGPEILLPGNKAKVVFDFEPINSRMLYHYTGWAGDMERSYGLSLDFLQNAQNEVLTTNFVQIEMPIEKYRDFLENKAQEPYFGMYSLFESSSNLYALMEPYIIKNIPTLRQKKSQSGMDGQGGMSHTIIIQGQEFYLDGLLVRLSLYRVRKKVRLYLKVANKRYENQTVDLNEVFLEADGEIFKFTDLETRMKDKGPKYEIKPNGRIELFLDFELKEEYQSLSLNLKGIKYKGEKSYFPQSLLYTNVVMGLNKKI